jgi:ATP-dependent DNA helicase RecG
LSFFENKIEFLKGVGAQKAELLQKDLGIFTFGDLIEHYPFRYEDRTKFHNTSQLNDSLQVVQIAGRVSSIEIVGTQSKKRLQVKFRDSHGFVELIWFQGISFFEKFIKLGGDYIIYGKPVFLK